MEVKFLKKDKNEVEVQVDNVTVAEVLRVYLNEQGIEFAAWKREHPSKPVVLRIKASGKTVGKAVADAVSAVKKDSEALKKAVK